MYLSHLLIDVGDNPDRPRPGRLWLRNLYHVHQRLCMAFPSSKRKEDDPAMLKPFYPDDFAADQVHMPRDYNAGFLFRIDPHPGGNVSIIVLSALKPDWDFAFGLDPNRKDPDTGKPFGNAGYLLAAPPSEPQPLNLKIEPGAKFRFRLKVNPTRRLRAESVDKKGQKIDEKKIGGRVPVPYDKLKEWLVRKGTGDIKTKYEGCGFQLLEITNTTTGYVYFNQPIAKGQKEKKGCLFSVLFDGILEITDVVKFKKALISGIGSAKAFGFGLITIAPLNNE